VSLVVEVGSSVSTESGKAADSLCDGLLGSDLARCVGEMDAELRVELSSRMNGFYSELRDFCATVASKVAVVEVRVAGIEATCNAETRQFGSRLEACDREVKQFGDLNISDRLSALEGWLHLILRDAKKPICVPASEEGQSATAPTPSISSGKAASRTRVPEGEVTRMSSVASALAESTSGELPMPRTAELKDDDRRTQSLPPSTISEDLKESLKGLVSAVHRTLGEPGGPASGAPASEEGPPSHGLLSASGAASPRAPHVVRRTSAPAAGDQGSPGPVRRREQLDKSVAHTQQKLSPRIALQGGFVHMEDGRRTIRSDGTLSPQPPPLEGRSRCSRTDLAAAAAARPLSLRIGSTSTELASTALHRQGCKPRSGGLASSRVYPVSGARRPAEGQRPDVRAFEEPGAVLQPPRSARVCGWGTPGCR